MRALIVPGLVLVLLCGCRKEPELITGNTAPYYDGIPTVVVENYVNRLFIDLIGREPLDAEMSTEVATLEAAALGSDARRALVNKLMTNTDFIAGDSSYKNAYYTRQYELYKARCLEGASDATVDFYIGLEEFAALSDSLAGDSAGYQQHRHEADKLLEVKSSRTEYRDGVIDIREVFARMVYNRVYDQINMNTFNFVNATFDDLYTRFPTTAEFDAAYNMVEYSAPQVLFGMSGQNKADYVDIMVANNEFLEGMVRWSYLTFMGREASTYEIYQAMSHFATGLDLQRVQRDILITDEYANFQ